MNCELKGTVNMKLQGGETVKFTDVLYVPQSVKNILIFLGVVSKWAIVGDTKYKMTIKKNDVNMILNVRNEKNESTMFYLRSNIYAPEGSPPQEANRNIP